MTGGKSTRRRKKISHTNVVNELSKPNSPLLNGHPINACKTIIFVVILAFITLGLYLTWLYINSPISAVPVDDIRVVPQLSTWLNGENTLLQNGIRFLPELEAPESIATDQEGKLYAGLADGRIVKISDDDNGNREIIDLTEGFDFAENSERQGKRPLGLRIVNSTLYFADAVQGVFQIDLKTRKWGKVVAYNDINSHIIYANDLTITADGTTMYFTDISKRWSYTDIQKSILEMECSGRILEVDLTTNSITKVVFEGLCVPNGIELDHTESKLLVSENSRRRITVIDRKYGKITKHVHLPGGTDNIRRSHNGGYWAPVPFLSRPIFDFILRFPTIRNILASILDLEGLLECNVGVVIKLDDNFEPVYVYYDIEGKVARFVTQVTELNNGDLVLGSYLANGIVKLDRKFING
uniref:adipocyte plasma membrane-associated protein-like n=1 Tax=Styela clava TaxID=7725 RepID=UPI00193956FA|nr:adipocyte plasma membrane-associated protein-like [Styela clava]